MERGRNLKVDDDDDGGGGGGGRGRSPACACASERVVGAHAPLLLANTAAGNDADADIPVLLLCSDMGEWGVEQHDPHFLQPIQVHVLGVMVHG